MDIETGYELEPLRNSQMPDPLTSYTNDIEQKKCISTFESQSRGKNDPRAIWSLTDASSINGKSFDTGIKPDGITHRNITRSRARVTLESNIKPFQVNLNDNTPLLMRVLLILVMISTQVQTTKTKRRRGVVNTNI